MKKLIDIDLRSRATAEVAMEHHWLQTLSTFNVERADIRNCLINFKNFRSVGPL